MSGLGQYDKFWKEPEGQVESNNMPDGEYAIEIFNLKHYPKPDEGKDVFVLEGLVCGGEYNNEPMTCIWSISDRKNIEYTIGDMFQFAQACGVPLAGVSDFESSEVRQFFCGKKFKATKKKSGEYSNWKYFKAVEGAVAERKKDEIDLDEDPFKEDSPPIESYEPSSNEDVLKPEPDPAPPPVDPETQRKNAVARAIVYMNSHPDIFDDALKAAKIALDKFEDARMCDASFVLTYCEERTKQA
jgi:hypothetical protein